MGSGTIKELDTLCNWLQLKIVGEIIAIKGNNITSEKMSSIENNIQKIINLIA